MNKHKCVIFTLAYTSFMTDSHNCSGRKNTAAAAAAVEKRNLFNSFIHATDDNIILFQ